MKNKTMTYGLMAVVLVIWGLVFYRIFAGMDSGEDTGFIPSTRKVIQPVEQEEEQVLVLYANYRDPFLGGTLRPVSFGNSSSSSSVPQMIKKKIPEKEVIPIDWSFLDYVGIVFNKETKKKVSLLVVNGKEYMVNDKDVINGVTILAKEKDSIQVEYTGVKKWIRR